MSAPTPEAEKAALAWLDYVETSSLHGGIYATAVKALLAEPRMPEKPTPAAIAAMHDVLRSTQTCVSARIYRALREHLSKPATRTIDKWIVTYWSKNQRRTISCVADDEADADRIVSGNGPTARKHRIQTEEPA